MKNYIHHIVITVSDVRKSTEFYKKVLDWRIRKQREGFTEFVSPDDPMGKEFLFVIGTPRDEVLENNRFDRNRPGLDHFAFAVDTLNKLKIVEGRLKKEKIEMENGGITDNDFGGTAIFCKDPDGMKIEFHLKQ